jgi:hypothetical protein
MIVPRCLDALCFAHQIVCSWWLLLLPCFPASQVMTRVPPCCVDFGHNCCLFVDMHNTERHEGLVVNFGGVPSFCCNYFRTGRLTAVFRLHRTCPRKDRPLFRRQSTSIVVACPFWHHFATLQHKPLTSKTAILVTCMSACWYEGGGAQLRC